MKSPLILTGTLMAATLMAACQADQPQATADAPAEAAQAAAPATDAPPATQAQDAMTDYLARASALRDALQGGGDIPALRQDATALMDLGAGMVPAFVEEHPHCREYLDVALQVRTAWPTLDLETIEHDYHHDGILPQIENSGVCYHMKDLITHPATVLVVLKDEQPDWDKARAEVEEIIAHAGVVERGPEGE